MSPADWSDTLTAALEGHAFWIALLTFLGATVVGTLLMVPAWIFPLAAGAAFGWTWGTLVSIVAGALAAQAAYLLSRHALRGLVERRAKRVKVFKAVDKAMHKAPLKVVTLLRLSPVLPSGAKSYLMGLTCVRPMPYALGSALGTLPGTALKAWVGSAGREVLEGGSPAKWAMLAAGVVATLGVTLLVGRLARRELGL